MSKKAEVVTLQSGTNVPSGTVMHLTRQQADARRHALVPVKGWHDRDGKPDQRMAFTSNAQVFFKAGEELGLEGELDRGVAIAAGVNEPAAGVNADGDTAGMATMRKQFDAAYAKQGKELEAAKASVETAREEGIKAGRAELLKEVEAYNAAAEAHEAADDKVAEAEQALADEQEPAKKPALQHALDIAKTEAAAAKSTVEALPKIKA